MFELGLYFSLSIGFSFLCSILEAVLLSVTPTYVRRELKKGSTTGKLLEEYKQDIDRPLSAILTLNTIAHTVGAIMVGATAGELYGSAHIRIAGISLSYESLIAGGMTLAILLLSEIIPKTIGANNWKALSPFTVKTLRGILFILAPFVWMSQLITRSLKKEKDKAVLTRSDFMAMTELGISEGVLEKSESTIINNVLNFEQVLIREIMTPRSVTFMVAESTSVKDFLEMDGCMVHSRVPIYEGDKDNVTGIVLKDDVLAAKGNGEEERPLSEYKREVITVSDDMPLAAFMKKTAKDKQHIHIVTDDFGHMLGVVTMEDLIETLLGTEIVDETDVVVDLQKHAREEWKRKNSGE